MSATKKIGNLVIFPTNSILRIAFIFDVISILNGIMNQFKIDLITTQNPWEEGIIALITSKIVGIKFMPQIHFDLFSKKWLFEKKINIFRIVTAIIVIKLATSVRVVSSSLEENMKNKLKISANRIFNIPVGVNFVPVLSETKEKLREDIDSGLINKKIILFVGYFYPSKNLKLWVESAKLISRSIDAHFLMIGNGSQFEMINKYVEDIGMNGHFTFMNEVKHDRLPKIYAAADIFLLTSSNESFGRVVVESYLSGVPVISTACSGPKDLIIDQCTGFLISKNEPTEISNVAIKLLSNDDARTKMGLEGKRVIESKFKLDSLADKLVASWVNTVNEL